MITSISNGLKTASIVMTMIRFILKRFLSLSISQRSKRLTSSYTHGLNKFKRLSFGLFKCLKKTELNTLTANLSGLIKIDLGKDIHHFRHGLTILVICSVCTPCIAILLRTIRRKLEKNSYLFLKLISHYL
jgi:hypothetical protein